MSFQYIKCLLFFSGQYFFLPFKWKITWLCFFLSFAEKRITKCAKNKKLFENSHWYPNLPEVCWILDTSFDVCQFVLSWAKKIGVWKKNEQKRCCHSKNGERYEVNQKKQAITKHSTKKRTTIIDDIFVIAFKKKPFRFRKCQTKTNQPFLNE